MRDRCADFSKISSLNYRSRVKFVHVLMLAYTNLVLELLFSNLILSSFEVDVNVDDHSGI